MAELNGSQTHENLKYAFAGESQANRRYLYFAKVAVKCHAGAKKAATPWTAFG